MKISVSKLKNFQPSFERRQISKHTQVRWWSQKWDGVREWIHEDLLGRDWRERAERASRTEGPRGIKVQRSALYQGMSAGRSRQTCQVRNASSGEREPLWGLAEHEQVRFVVQITLWGYSVEEGLEEWVWRWLGVWPVRTLLLWVTNWPPGGCGKEEYKLPPKFLTFKWFRLHREVRPRTLEHTALDNVGWEICRFPTERKRLWISQAYRRRLNAVKELDGIIDTLWHFVIKKASIFDISQTMTLQPKIH